MPFLNNVKMKSPLSRYENEKVMPEVRRFVLKHLQNLNKVIADIKQARCTISPKSQFYINKINAVGFVCTKEGKKPGASKVKAILL